MSKKEERKYTVTTERINPYCVCSDCPVIESLTEKAATAVVNLVKEGKLKQIEARYCLNLILQISYTADDEVAIWTLITLMEMAGKTEEELNDLFEYVHICEFADGDSYRQFMEIFFKQREIDELLADDENNTPESIEVKHSQR